MKIRTPLKIFIASLWIILAVRPAYAASGLFPKMPPAATVYLVDCHNDTDDAKMTALALEGLINQSSAEVFLIEKPLNEKEVKDLGVANTPLKTLDGADGGLRALFQKYQARVQKMFVYDPAKDWTWCLAMMAAAQQNGIPVTESTRESLASEFKWTGVVEDYRNQWDNRIQAYDWALVNLMPQCSRQVVFILDYAKRLEDYVVATKGFAFNLDYKGSPAEEAEMEKIFRTGGYTVGSSLMGYSDDDANTVANKFGIGYTVSGLYDNGSYWSSFADKTYRQAQAPGHAADAAPGKVYVSLTWSDGDNVAFDQNAIYNLWHDPAHGSVPMGTTLNPVLQELNPKLMDWYYANMTANDELMAGGSGFQFIYGDDYNSDLFPAWCKLNREWMADAGFHTVSLWHTTYPGPKYTGYVNTCGLSGIYLTGELKEFGKKYGVITEGGIPAIHEGHAARNEDDIFNYLAAVAPDENAPVFASVKCIVGGIVKDGEEGGGYTKIKRQVDRLNAAYPGRYVFLLPKDLFATIAAYYKLSSR